MVWQNQILAGAAGAGGGTGAVNFNDSTWLTRGADLTGVSDSDFMSFSFWYKFDAAADTDNTLLVSENTRFLMNYTYKQQVEMRTNTGARTIDSGYNVDLSDTTNWKLILLIFWNGRV